MPPEAAKKKHIVVALITAAAGSCSGACGLRHRLGQLYALSTQSRFHLWDAGFQRSSAGFRDFRLIFPQVDGFLRGFKKTFGEKIKISIFFQNFEKFSEISKISNRFD